MTYSVVPDQIEAGTFMLACVASHGIWLLKIVLPKHLECITAKVLEMGAHVHEINGDTLHVWCDSRTSRANIKLHHTQVSYRFTTSNGCCTFYCRWYKYD